MKIEVCNAVGCAFGHVFDIKAEDPFSVSEFQMCCVKGEWFGFEKLVKFCQLNELYV